MSIMNNETELKAKKKEYRKGGNIWLETLRKSLINLSKIINS